MAIWKLPDVFGEVDPITLKPIVQEHAHHTNGSHLASSDSHGSLRLVDDDDVKGSTQDILKEESAEALAGEVKQESAEEVAGQVKEEAKEEAPKEEEEMVGLELVEGFPEWRKVDRNDGSPYYFNIYTQETRWDPPEA